MSSAEIVLGSFAVTTNGEDVDAYAEALGLPLGEAEVPVVYSLRLLATPPVARAIDAVVRKKDHALLHHRQRFIVHRQLQRNQLYQLELKLSNDGADPILFQLDGSIIDPGGHTMVEFTAFLISKRNDARAID